MKRKQKFYVVWTGEHSGIYNTWEECFQYVNGIKGAIYKSFSSIKEAEEAFKKSPINNNISLEQYESAFSKEPTKNFFSNRIKTGSSLPTIVNSDAWAVDAACSGNPGKMEYRGIDLQTGQVVFHFGPIYGTNNIGEFLAIVHALALLYQKAPHKRIYSDSRNAMLWIKARKCKTKLIQNKKSETAHNLIKRAENWLQSHTWNNPIIKWDTAHWGEIPADFGRK